MSAFDEYRDPQLSSDESGGLLGRLLACQQEQAQHQVGAGFGQMPSAPRADVPQQPLPQPVDLGQAWAGALKSTAGDRDSPSGAVNPTTANSPMAQPPILGSIGPAAMAPRNVQHLVGVRL